MGCIWFDVCWCYIAVWLGWCIHMQAEAYLITHKEAGNILEFFLSKCDCLIFFIGSNTFCIMRKRLLNPLTPNNPYRGRTAPLTSKRCILYIYSTNIGTEYFKHSIYSLFFSLQNAVCFIILTYLVPVLFTFYIQCVLKFKKIIPVPNG